MPAGTHAGLIPSTWVIRLVLIVLVIGICFVVDTRISHACSCAYESPSEALEGSSAVFAGTVVAVHNAPRDTRSQARWRKIYEFKVNTVWKGPLLETVFLTHADASEPYAPIVDCIRTFGEGVEYIVYGRGHLCSRTGLLSSAHEDIAALGEGQAPIPGTSEPKPEIREEGSHQAWLIPMTAVVSVAALYGLVVRIRTQRRTTKPETVEEEETQMWLIPMTAVASIAALYGLVVRTRTQRRRRKDI